VPQQLPKTEKQNTWHKEVIQKDKNLLYFMNLGPVV